MMTIQATPSIVVTGQDHKRLSAFAAARNGQISDVRRLLAQELDHAVIVESADVPPNVVTMRSRVIVRDDETDTTRVFTLVFPGEEDISIGNLSILTPAGAALIGLSEGETLTWSTRDGRTKEMTVVKILYQPEADGRYDL